MNAPCLVLVPCWLFTLTVPLSTQVCKWVPANSMLGVTLRWTSIPFRGQQKYSKSLHKPEIITGVLSGVSSMKQFFFSLSLSSSRKPTSSVREVLAPAYQQSNSDCRTSSTENPSMLDCTKTRKTLFNSRENSLMVPVSNTQVGEDQEWYIPAECHLE